MFGEGESDSRGGGLELLPFWRLGGGIGVSEAWVFGE
jgi:hypothetical protein